MLRNSKVARCNLGLSSSIILKTTSKSILITSASAFQANLVTEESAKSRNERHVVAMDVRAEDKESDGGTGCFRNTCRSEQSFWRWRLLRYITDSPELNDDIMEKESIVARKVAPKREAWSGVILDDEWRRAVSPMLRSTGSAKISAINTEVIGRFTIEWNVVTGVGWKGF
jgi:hypothetical protein